MAAILTPFPSYSVPPRLSVPGQQAFLVSHLIRSSTVSRKHISFRVQAAKLPAGVSLSRFSSFPPNIEFMIQKDV
ncbi:unnamed protein product [Cuscuta epithymum]|uniref:Uncharacterized protein n=1 Tax=Cuscuta epithymum TaxID=186058 RepID=A0AAV0FT59_9ASTE|nr:unnamed protein product [Cuscuta epithymum]